MGLELTPTPVALQPCVPACAEMSGNKMPDRRIEIVMTDITTLHVDAVVNAANQTARGGGVDGAERRPEKAAFPILAPSVARLRLTPPLPLTGEV